MSPVSCTKGKHASKEVADLRCCGWLLKGAVTSITEPAAADMTYAFGLFYGGFVQLLAGMWEMYKVSAAFLASAWTCMRAVRANYFHVRCI